MEKEATAAYLYWQLESTVPGSGPVPDCLRQFYRWMGENGSVGGMNSIEGISGDLWKRERFPEWSPGRDETYGTEVSFSAETDRYYSSWFGSTNPEIRQRLCVFATTGAEGSHAGLWLDDTNTLRTVHMGSGSGSTWVGLIG